MANNGRHMWLRDLTQECVEPNPGPSAKQAFDLFGKSNDISQEFLQALLQKLRIVCKNNFPTSNHVKSLTADIIADVWQQQGHMVNDEEKVSLKQLLDEAVDTVNVSPQGLGLVFPKNDPVSPKVQLTWAVSSTIAINNYHISQNDLVFPRIVETANERGCTLVQGSFRSGKSSHCEALEAYLNSQPNCYCVRIELSLIRFIAPGKSPATTLSEQIFNAVVDRLKPHLPSTYNMSEFSVQGALQAIKAANSQKRLIVLWDEFQLLVEPGAEAIRGDITEACRALVHSSTAEVIYSCLGFGTFNLQFLDSLFATNNSTGITNLSPFHQKPPIFMPQAAYNNMKTTIMLWLADGNELFAENVIDAWIQVSNGFLGVFSFIGYMLTTRALGAGLTYSEWTTEYAKILRVMASAQGTFTRVIASVINSSTSCKEMIRVNMLANKPIIVAHNAPYYVDMMNMASAGVFTRELVADMKDRFVVSCPAIRHLVLDLFSSPHQSLIPDELFEKQNHKKLCVRVLDQLTHERQTLNNQLCWTEKKGFPSEATIQSLIFSDIKQALVLDPTKANYVVLMETGQRIKPDTSNKKVKGGKKRSTTDSEHATTKKRSDLLIINGRKVIIELKADVQFTGVRSSSNKSSTDKLNGAISQVVHYTKAQGVNNGILLNIVSHDSKAGSLQAQYQQDGVTVYVHQARFTKNFTGWEWIAPVQPLNFPPEQQ